MTVNITEINELYGRSRKSIMGLNLGLTSGFLLYPVLVPPCIVNGINMHRLEGGFTHFHVYCL